MRTSRDEMLELTEAATAVALSVLLGSIRLLELPNGGSITLAIVPLLALAVIRGAKRGFLVGFCAGITHALIGGTILHPIQLILDYGLAYTVLGVAGFAQVKQVLKLRFFIGIACALQLLMMTISGVVFFAPLMGTSGAAAVIYSVTYNATTVIPELILALLFVPRAARAICRANPADAWRRGIIEPPAVEARTPRYLTRVTAPSSRELPRKAKLASTLGRPVTLSGIPADRFFRPVSLTNTAPPRAVTNSRTNPFGWQKRRPPLGFAHQAFGRSLSQRDAPFAPTKTVADRSPDW